MTESFLTTDIIVIIVLVVVLVLVGIGAFLIHYYWTKIGVSEIWNTTKWSSIRSSIYRTVSRFSQRSATKSPTKRPYTGPATYKEEINRFESKDPLENRASIPVITSYVIPNKQSPIKKPLSAIEHNSPIPKSYATKIGQPIDNTKIYNIHEYDDKYNDPSTVIERQRF